MLHSLIVAGRTRGTGLRTLRIHEVISVLGERFTRDQFGLILADYSSSCHFGPVGALRIVCGNLALVPSLHMFHRVFFLLLCLVIDVCATLLVRLIECRKDLIR